jgi:hypothetical protein
MTEVHDIERPLRSMSLEEKMNLVVSTVVGVDGKVQVVSRYKDNEWKFYVEVRGKNLARNQKTITWNIALPDGRSLTDPQHAELLESAKDFILSLRREPADGRERLKARTLIGKFSELTPLLRWMVSQGMTRFEHLAGRTMEYVPYARLKQKSPGKKVVRGTHEMRLIVVQDLYHQRDKLQDALRAHPWPDDSATSLAGIKKGGRGNKPKTDPIPDNVVNELVPIALEYVQEKADFLLGAREATADAREEALAKYAHLENLNSLRKATCRDAKYVADGLGLNGLRELNEELLLLRTACYIVIDLFSGIRDSEMAELQAGCVGETIDKAGVELAWMHGNIIKHQHPDKPHAWIVPPVVVTAIKVMEEYAKPLQEKLQAEGEQILKRLDRGKLSSEKEGELHLRYSEIHGNAQGLFLSDMFNHMHPIGPLSNMTANEDLTNFCRRFKILGNDGKPYPLTTRHFRRTFAYYIARTGKYFDLNFLSKHYGHWCTSHTEGYTHGAPEGYMIDRDLLQEIEKDKEEVQYEMLKKKLLEDTPVVGGGSKWILNLRPQVRTVKNKEELIRKLSDNINIVGTGTSWCVTDGRTVCCGGKCYVKRTMCKDCPTGFIGPEFLPMWKHIEEQQQEIIDCDDLGPDQKLEAREMLEQARMIIADLGGAH